MATRNYDSGANFERAVKKYFEDHGYDAVRSAGSHGKFDVIADNGAQLWKVQCKRHGSKAYAEKVLAEILEDSRLKFPLIGMPIVLFVATDLKDGKLIGYAKRLMPSKDTLQNMLKFVEAVNGNKKRTKGAAGARTKAEADGDDL